MSHASASPGHRGRLILRHLLDQTLSELRPHHAAGRRSEGEQELDAEQKLVAGRKLEPEQPTPAAAPPQMRASGL